MDIPRELIEFSAAENVQDLSGGPAFASLQVANAFDLMWANVDSVPAHLQRKLLLFDWWIRNGDRCLGELGGNVNLMLNPNGELVVIDHNAAFDMALTLEEYQQHHVFRDQIGAHGSDLLARLEYFPQLDAAVGDWGRITSLLPDEWIYRDTDQIDETEPTLQQRLQILERFNTEQFWGQL
jgi:hypothetical protein